MEIVLNNFIKNISNLYLFLYFLAGFIFIVTLFPLFERGLFFIREKLVSTIIPNINYRHIRYMLIILRTSFIIIILVTLYLSNLPVKALIILTILNLLFRENFPFSHYPMYSKFSYDTRYIYITDENDNPIPIKNVFGIKSDFLKKIYINEAKKIAKTRNTDYWLLQPSELKPAAKSTLKYLENLYSNKNLKDKYKALKLYHVNIYLRKRKVGKENYLVDKLNLC